MTSWGTVSFSG